MYFLTQAGKAVTLNSNEIVHSEGLEYKMYSIVIFFENI